VVFFNYTTMQVTAKIVYYGPGLCGKTTNLQFIHHKTAQGTRGEMVSLETEGDRTLFFDLLPIDVGVIGGMKVRLQLYTVPGQVFYNATRKLVLKGVDGVVFVADSQAPMLEANVESLRNLDENLAELGVDLGQVPVVFQYNKRDLRNILSVEELDQAINSRAAPHFEAAARHGIGVFESLKSISRLALMSIRHKLVADDAARRTGTSAVVVAAPAAPVVPALLPATLIELPQPASAAEAGPGPDDPLAALVPGLPPVEFAEEDTDKHEVRPVETKGKKDIHRELAALRTLAAGGSGKFPAFRAARPAGPSAEVEKRLHDMLAPEREKQEVRRKAALDVPGALLRQASDLSVQLVFDQPGREPQAFEAVGVKLVGNRKLGRLTLHLEIDVKGK
jgi:signal recognition particle receptor subunit beta